MEGWVQTTVAVSSAIAALLIVFLICFISCKLIKLRRQKNGSPQLACPKLLFNSHESFPPIQMQQTYLNANGTKTGFQNVQGLKQKPVFPHLELLKLQTLRDSSDTESEVDTLRVSSSEETRSLGAEGDQAAVIANGASPGKEVPTIEFSIVYVSCTNSLTIHVIRVANLPARYRKNCLSFVKVSLLARKKSSFQTQVFKKSLNPEYEENFSFPGYSLDEIKTFTIRLCVYAKQSRLLRKRLIGELKVPLTQMDLAPDIPQTVSEGITPGSSTKKKHKNSSSHKEHGQLFILLQYQVSAQRMKVLIRKAENLPKTNILLGQPEYYVIVSLLKDIEAVTYKETRPVSGPNPVWNQPFLFDIPFETCNQHWFQFLIMRGIMYSRDGVVGQVLIGPETTSLGSAHWSQAMEPKLLECAKWHAICPVDDM